MFHFYLFCSDIDIMYSSEEIKIKWCNRLKHIRMVKWQGLQRVEQISKIIFSSHNRNICHFNFFLHSSGIIFFSSFQSHAMSYSVARTLFVRHPLPCDIQLFPVAMFFTVSSCGSGELDSPLAHTHISKNRSC